MTSWRTFSGTVKTVGGDILSTDSVGYRLHPFLSDGLSDSGAFHIQLLNAAFVPLLSHNL